ncbi:MAG: hypothetical protein Tsb009_21080 [Planctomycetaceae bacterium]
MQVWALLVDSYRLLLNRKLFWITLAISAILILVYASIGFDDTGISLFFGLSHFDSDVLKAGTDAAKGFYMGIFSTFIVGIWLTWGATILALVSTAPIFNDFMADGSIDLVLSKPLNRVTVFFVKYLGGLLFVLIQMTLFTVGVFLCVGWRVGEWSPSILWAIPLVVVFFSYLYCMSVLFTMLTRSTIASLMLTMVFWLIVFAGNFAERQLTSLRIYSEVMADFAGSDFETNLSVKGRRESSRKTGGDSSGSNDLAVQKAQEKRRKERVEAQRKRWLTEAESYKTWQDRLRVVNAILPKTKQTTDLVEYWTVEKGQGVEATIAGSSGGQQQNPADEIRKRAEEYYRNQSPWYIIGTSLAFEFVILSLACYLFVRRDF